MRRPPARKCIFSGEADRHTAGLKGKGSVLDVSHSLSGFARRLPGYGGFSFCSGSRSGSFALGHASSLPASFAFGLLNLLD